MIPLILLLAITGLMQAARSFAESGVTGGTELAFGFLLLSAYFTAKILNRIGLPKLTGYLLSGILAGPYVFHLVTPVMTDALKVVADTATAILALEAGSELNLKKVRPLMGTLRGITIFAVLGSMIAIAAVLFAMRAWLPFFDGMDLEQTLIVCLVIGVALSAQSPAVVMAMLAELRAEGPLSSVMLASVVVADFTVITLFSVVLAITGAIIGGQIDVQQTALEVAWELIGSIVFGLSIGMLIGVFLRYVKEGAALFALMVCVVVAEIGSRVALDPLIVLLSAGIWLRNFSKADANDLLHSFEAAQLPVFLVFFALAGAKFHLDQLIGAIIPVAIVAATRATSFFLGSKIAMIGSDVPPAVRKYAWFGLVPQAGLALALALILQRTFGGEGKTGIAAFGNGASTIVLGVVALNELTAPVILRMMLMRSGEAGKKKGVDFAAGGH